MESGGIMDPLERKIYQQEMKAWQRLLVWCDLLDAAGWCVALAGSGGEVWLGERAKCELADRCNIPCQWSGLLKCLETLPAESVYLATRGMRIWRGAQSAAEPVLPAGLTPRETEIFGWLKQGKTGPEISLICGCSIRTIEKHIANLYRKIGAKNRGMVILGNPGSGL
jgi:DNA-binding CsgD family transcriptional regulator